MGYETTHFASYLIFQRHDGFAATPGINMDLPSELTNSIPSTNGTSWIWCLHFLNRDPAAGNELVLDELVMLDFSSCPSLLGFASVQL